MKVTVVTTMRNEGRHLLEWIAYHRTLGVTDFLVYTNDCEDGTEILLDLLPDVTHVPIEAGEKPPQWRALRAAWEHPVVQSADWVACLDCDEFINLAGDLRDIAGLVERTAADAVLLPWRLFGHADQIDLTDKLTTQVFDRAAPEEMLYPAIGSYFKTLFRREAPFRQFGVHRPKQKNAERHGVPIWVDGSGDPVTVHLAGNDGRIMNWGNPIANGLVQLNHYSVRSVSDYMIKRSRGLPNHQSKSIDLTYWVERNFNTVEDVSIQDRLSKLQECLREFREIPGLLEAEQSARNWAKDKLASLLADPSELAVFGKLILAGSSVPPPKETALRLIRAYQVANE
jgi:hypothetical protein